MKMPSAKWRPICIGPNVLNFYETARCNVKQENKLLETGL